MKLITKYLKDIAKNVLDPLGMFNTYSGIYPHTIGNIFKDKSAWVEMCKLDVITHLNTIGQKVVPLHNSSSTSKTTYALYYTEEQDGQSASWWVDYNS